MVLNSNFFYYLLQSLGLRTSILESIVIWPAMELLMVFSAIYYILSSPFSQKNKFILSGLLILLMGLKVFPWGDFQLSSFMEIITIVSISFFYFQRNISKKSSQRRDKVKLISAVLIALLNISIIIMANYIIIKEIRDQIYFDLLFYHSLFRTLSRLCCLVFVLIHIYSLYQQKSTRLTPDLIRKINKIGNTED